VFSVNKIEIDGFEFLTYEVFLPKTTLLVVANDVGYIMCAALDIDFFNNTPKLIERQIIAARAEGVRSIDDLINAKVAKITHKARNIGITEGMSGRDALLLMAKTNI